MELENRLVMKSSKIIICDTDLLETMVYSEKYFDGYCDANLKNCAINNTYSLYLLTNIDIPWVKDDLRDRPKKREEMFEAFEKALIKNKKPYGLISGNLEQRIKTAINEIDKLI